jgi:hypothetical protein
VKVHHRGSAGHQDALDAPQQSCLMPWPANEGVETGEVMDAVPEGRLKIIRANKNHVLLMVCLSFGTGVCQRIYRQVAMKNKLVQRSGSECAMPGTRGKIAKDQIRFTLFVAQKFKYLAGLPLPQLLPLL